MKLKISFLQITIGIIRNAKGEVLISKRANAVHQGGLWEFPGGKVEQGETVLVALKRELSEELGIIFTMAKPLIKIRHHYQDLSVLLNVWEIDEFSGTVYGKEGQKVKWLSVDKLSEYDFPAANNAIITAVQLPRCYAILDDSYQTALVPKLKKILNHQVRLIQMRLKNSMPQNIEQFLNKAIPLCQQHQAHILINSGVAMHIKTQGLHLTCTDLMALNKRPANKGWLAASCHNLLQLQHAEKIGLDFAVLSPVLPTPTHPDAKILGWKRVAQLIEKMNIPVFVLGGVTINDIEHAQILGAQGIAGIRAFL